MESIKFRAWNHDTKKMSKTFTLMDNLEWYQDEAPCYNLMRFTGLLDRLGKEIYEGDILGNGVSKFEVEYREGMFVCEYNNVAHIARGNFEVTGNIYENPELLKEK